jgi:DNA-binding response OmpR family regulator
MRSVLHVEDDLSKVSSLREFLEDFEVDVVTDHAWSVAEGLQKLEAAPWGSYACVVSDWNLGDGYGRRIVEECNRLNIPVCVLSGSIRLMEDVPWVTSDRLVEVVRFIRQHVEAP